MKTTPIIKALEILFSSTCFMFTLLTLVALLNPYDTIYKDVSKDFLLIPSVVVLIALSRFREKSLDNEIKKITKDVK